MRSERFIVLAAGAALLLGPLLGCQASPAPSPAPAVEQGTEAVAADPLEVLHEWDARRAAAFAAGDGAALRALYATGSRAGHRDVRLLREYAARGLRVTGLQTQVLAAQVEAERPDRLVLVVTDRVTGAVAAGAHSRVQLPTGLPRSRVVVLVERSGRWVVAAVRMSDPG